MTLKLLSPNSVQAKSLKQLQEESLILCLAMISAKDNPAFSKKDKEMIKELAFDSLELCVMKAQDDGDVHRMNTQGAYNG